MSMEWVRTGQALIWAIWILVAVTMGEIFNGREGGRIFQWWKCPMSLRPLGQRFLLECG